MNKDKMSALEILTLEKIRYGCTSMVCAQLIDELSIEPCATFIADNILISLRGHVWGREISRYTSVEYDTEVPDTLWDHVKWKYTFLQKIFGKPKLTKIQSTKTTKVYKVCPHLDYKSRDEHLKWLSMPQHPPLAELVETEKYTPGGKKT